MVNPKATSPEPQLPPPGKERAAVIVGRFNPPTKGHYALISAAKAYIRKHPKLNLLASPVVIVIAGVKSSEDRRRNPLTAEQRIKFMQASGHANGVKFMTATDPLAGFAAMREAGLEPILVVAGEDRAAKYVELLDRYFTAADGSPIKHHALTLDRGGDRTPKSAVDAALQQLEKRGALDVEQISASVVRAAVEHDLFPEFMELTGLEGKEALARRLFNAVKAALREDADVGT